MNHPAECIPDYFPDIHTHHVSPNPCSVFSVRVNSQLPENPESFFPENNIPLFSVALHPWDTDEPNAQEYFQQSLLWMQHPQCVAIGECGLDALTGNISRQKEFLKEYLQLALNLKMPLILHVVKAWPDFFRILHTFPERPHCVVHGFRGNAALAHELLENGVDLSFGKHFLHDSRLQQIFQALPENRFFLETDEAPATLLPELFSLAAQLRSVSLPVYHANALRQFRDLFGRNGNGRVVLQ